MFLKINFALLRFMHSSYSALLRFFFIKMEISPKNKSFNLYYEKRYAMHRGKAKKKRAIKISNLCLEKEVIEKNVIIARGAILMSCKEHNIFSPRNILMYMHWKLNFIILFTCCAFDVTLVWVIKAMNMLHMYSHPPEFISFNSSHMHTLSEFYKEATLYEEVYYMRKQHVIKAFFSSSLYIFDDFSSERRRR